MSSESVLRVDRVEERKRLGQFFTGDRLASLLAHLAKAEIAQSVIDPMAGTGDMLMAARGAGAKNARLGAIEVDPEAVSACVTRLGRSGETEAVVRTGDTFSPETWGRLRDQQWDLVITNPPYVRYQRTASANQGRVSLPSARDVRRGLIELIDGRDALSPSDRSILRILATSYSGLADLALPSWLLCASLVAVGGRLAMVVPNTWLTREYALPVLYLLRRYFELEFIVEDTQAVWFPDALVRTTLLVARRVEDRGTGLDASNRGHLRVKLDATTMDHRSIVGALLPDSDSPDREFARMVSTLRDARQSEGFGGCTTSWVSDESVVELLAGQATTTWIEACEPSLKRSNGARTGSAPAIVPQAVRAVTNGASLPRLSLDDYGWRVGQGLRTGANTFFYGECVDSSATRVRLSVDSTITMEPLEIPADLVRACIRKQHDLADGFTAPSDTAGRVLGLQGHALPEDLADAEKILGTRPYDVIPEPLASHIRRAATTDVSKNGVPKLIPGLSAVAPNVRRADADNPDRPPRFWYQLPGFAPRHTPALFLPRVNHGHPRAVANSEGLVVDANFSTMWRHDNTGLGVWEVLALLHSTWVSVVLESSATVLGGGALKVEAAHLRRVPIPALESSDVSQLGQLGAELARCSPGGVDALRDRIDAVVWPRVLGSEARVDQSAAGLGQLNRRLLHERSPSAAQLEDRRRSVI